MRLMSMPMLPRRGFCRAGMAQRFCRFPLALSVANALHNVTCVGDSIRRRASTPSGKGGVDVSTGRAGLALRWRQWKRGAHRADLTAGVAYTESIGMVTEVANRARLATARERLVDLR